ncbi:MAG: hypothetical protein Q9162_000414 [Coniocarpon cinnabarinum]
MLMQHSDLDFPKEIQLFPTRTEIMDYLDRLTDLRNGHHRVREYDAVAAACGHYTEPFIPKYEGIDRFNRRHPSVISHSKWFDRPENYCERKVLVIGMGPSGSDIAAQIVEYCEKPLLVSTRSTPLNLPSKALSLPAIESFIPEKRSVRFVDGRVERELDTILFCTGYLYCYPFLSPDLRRNLIYPPAEHKSKFNPGERCRNVFQHLFYTPDPTLAFFTLPWNIVPFPVAEVQAAVVARAWAGRLQLPNETSMRQWQDDTESEKGTGKAFHKLAPPSDVEYINSLSSWAEEAISLNGAHSPVNGSPRSPSTELGRKPPYWGPRHRWMRVNVPKFKKAFAEKGEARHCVTTLEELGFHFEG